MMKYDLVEVNPCARFYYKGTHTHPVRRTVLIIEDKPEYIRGYELREGTNVRSAAKAPIKTYNRDKIAKGEDLRQESPLRRLYPNKSTLVRKTLFNVVESGA